MICILKFYFSRDGQGINLYEIIDSYSYSNWTYVQDTIFFLSIQTKRAEQNCVDPDATPQDAV